MDSFNKTHIIVKLFKRGETYFSRSQAKRILSRLDLFKHITFDFMDVEFIGQGFADEIFRVWSSKYPAIKIVYLNANEDVKFMIKRTEKK